MTAGDKAQGIRPTAAIEVPENHLRALLEAHGLVGQPVAVVGIRGWVKSIVGAERGENQPANLTGVYDDPICVVTPDRCRTFVGNTDPSRTIEGRAILEAPQILWLSPGVHNRSKPPADRRPAFIQASPVSIRRYDAAGELGPLLADQWIGCNNHDGSWTTTGSAACQTVAPESWMAYVDMVLTALAIPITEWATVATRIRRGESVPDHWTAARFPYLLTV